jgi:hypothetical protein
MWGLVPRIMGRALIVIDADNAKGELHTIGLAQQHHPRGGEPGHGRGIGRGDVIFAQAGASRGRFAANVVEILHGIRNAVQWPQVEPKFETVFGRFGLDQCAFPGDTHKGVKVGIQLLDAVEQQPGHGERADLARPIGPPQPHYGPKGDVEVTHVLFLYRPASNTAAFRRRPASPRTCGGRYGC